MGRISCNRVKQCIRGTPVSVHGTGGIMDVQRFFWVAVYNTQYFMYNSFSFSYQTSLNYIFPSLANYTKTKMLFLFMAFSSLPADSRLKSPSKQKLLNIFNNTSLSIYPSPSPSLRSTKVNSFLPLNSTHFPINHLLNLLQLHPSLPFFFQRRSP